MLISPRKVRAMPTPPKTAAPDLELAHNRYNALLNTRKAGNQS